VFKASPDGHTLLLNGSALWLTQYLRESVPWDAIKDFMPITLTVISPNVLVVHPAVAAKSVKELIALARAKPGSLNYGTSGTGNSSHLAGELFKSMAGVDIVRVNYKGTSAALNDVMSGELQLMFTTTAVAPPLVKAGRMRALAVTSAQPTALLPGVTTVAASGLPGYESVSVLGLFAPAHTPVALINRLNQEVVQLLRKADVKEKFFKSGADVAASSPSELAAMIKSDMLRMGKVIRDAGIRD
jgi:tripartite-type tricarboxylate transporter receptor subunit TctC